jgi:hypothetical protein
VRFVGEEQQPSGQAPVMAEVAARRFRLGSPATAVVLFVLALALGVASLPLASLAGRAAGNNTGSVAAVAVLTVALAGVGLLVARHQAGNPIGWLLLGSGVCFALDGDASSYELADYLLRHGRLPFGWVAVLIQPAWAPAIALLAAAILVFPDGQLPSRLWRWPLRLYLAVAALWAGGAFAISATAVAGHHIQINPGGDLAIIDHPTGAAVLWGMTQDLFFTLLSVFLVACVIQQAVSYRRASGERRQQLKWLASGIAVCGVCGLASIVLSNRSGIWQVISDIATIGIAALPVSVAIAILRYRLYEIDRIISRTLAYTIVTGLLAGLYAGVILLATHVLSFSSPVAVAASTLAAAALFSPLRRRVQHVVDRRFNRARYDTDQTVAAFATGLKDAVDLDSIRHDLARTVHQALEPAHISVWISHHN